MATLVCFLQNISTALVWSNVKIAGFYNTKQMPRLKPELLWDWIKNEPNAKAINSLLIGLSAIASPITYVHSTLFPPPDDVIVFDASDFLYTEGVSSNTFRDPSGVCPYKLVYNQPPWKEVPLNAVYYRANLRRGGQYKLLVEYASNEPTDAPKRLVDVDVNNQRVITGALAEQSESWCLTRWESVGVLELNRGSNTIKFSRKGVFPHLRTIRLIRQ